MFMENKQPFLFNENIIFNLCFRSNDDIDLILCYESISGEFGCISCPSFGIEHKGNLEEYPFIQYQGDWIRSDNPNIEQIEAASLSHIKTAYICMLNYDTIIEGKLFDFSQINGELRILCKTTDEKDAIAFKIKNSLEGQVYLCCTICCENNRFYLLEEQKVLSIEEAVKEISGFNTICN